MRTSFLVPTWNRAGLLRQTLDSCLASTDPDYEIVVCDNGSTDDTPAVMESYLAAHDNIVYHRIPEHSHYTRCFTEILEHASGEFGKYVYDDDLVAPDFLERTLPYMDRFTGFVWTQAIIGADPWRGAINYVHPDGGGSKLASHYIWEQMQAAPHLPVSPGCAVFRVADLRTAQLDAWDYDGGTDLLLFLRIAARYKDVAHVPASLAWFRLWDGSTTIANYADVSRGYHAAREWFIARKP